MKRDQAGPAVSRFCQFLKAVISEYPFDKIFPQSRIVQTSLVLYRDGGKSLQLTRTPDILMAVAELRAKVCSPQVVVGFAAESENLLENARAKLAAKHFDLLVANDITAHDAGFAAETNRVAILAPDEGVEQLPLMSKAAVGEAVLDRLVAVLAAK